MGNSNNAEIKVNASQYWPNSKIKGLVVIHKAESTLKDIKNLYLHFQGYESGDDIKSSQSLVSQMFLLQNISNEELITKTISIPFTFRIPSHIKSTLDRDEYGIKYTLALFSETLNGWTDEMIKIPITIVERARQNKNINYLTRIHQMKGYLLQNLGEMKVQCKYEGDEFYVGDSIKLKILFDLRKSQQYVEDIFIQLIEKITMNPEKIKETIIRKQQLPGLFQKSIQELTIPFLLFNVKDVFYPTTNGNTLKLEYIIRIKIYTAIFNINFNEVVIDIPIKIYRRMVDSDTLDLKPQNFPDLSREFSLVELG